MFISPKSGVNSMSSGYNELKLEILGEAVHWEEVTAGDMAKTLERNHPSIAMALLRYHRQGLLSRYTIHRNEKVYAITDRGVERLDWLLEQDFKDSDDDDVVDEEEGENDDEYDESDTEQDDDDGLKDYETLIKLTKEIREIDKKLFFSRASRAGHK